MHRVELPLDLGILHPVSQGPRLRSIATGSTDAGLQLNQLSMESLLRAGRSSPDAVGGHSMERHQARRRFGKGVASIAFDRRDDLDVGSHKLGNLRFQANNLIFRASAFNNNGSSPKRSVLCRYGLNC